MPNTNWAYGFRPVKTALGAPWNGAANTYFIPASDSTAVFVGQLVKLANGGDANGVAAVTGNVASTDTPVGVVVGFKPDTADSPKYRLASTDRYVYVADDPNLIFAMQEDSVGSNIAAGDLFKFAAIVNPTAGNTTTGYSTGMIDSSDVNATVSTRAVQVLGLVPSPDNEIGANADYLVRLVRHSYR